MVTFTFFIVSTYEAPVPAPATEVAASDGPIASAPPKRAAEPKPADPDPPPKPLLPCVSEAVLHAKASAIAAFEAELRPKPAATPMPRFRTPGDAASFPPSRIAFVRDGAIRVIELPAGIERPLIPATAHADHPLWSPTGAYLAYLAPDAEDGPVTSSSPRYVHLVRGDGTGARRASPTPHHYAALAFSADGERLAFDSKEDIVVINVTERTERHWPIGAMLRVGPVFAEKGSVFAFAPDPMGLPQSVLVLGDADAPVIRTTQIPLLRDGNLQSLAFFQGQLLVAAEPAGTSSENVHLERIALEAPHAVTALGELTNTWRGYTQLVVAPGSARYVRATNIIARVYTDDGNGVGPGNWSRNDYFLVKPSKPPQQWLEPANASLPQPRFQMSTPVWAPDGRHLAFGTKLVQQRDDFPAEELAEGIVAVDADHPRADPFLVACGTSPTWGPAER